MTLPDVLPIDRPLIGLDLETTGTSTRDRIVELGLEIMRPHEPVKEYRTLVNPEMPIPPATTAVHHITDEMVKNAPTFAQLADNLLKGFVDCDYAGYNVRFDLRKLADEFKRMGKKWHYEGARVIDGFRLWQIVEARSLEDAVAYWLSPEEVAIIEDQPHAALWDTKVSTRIIAAQLTKCAKLPRDLQQLHALCSPGWYDAEGKFQWKDGVLTIAFGQHRGLAIQDVPRQYFSKFILKSNSDFSDKVKDLVRDALEGRYPDPPAVEDADDEENA